MKTSVVITTYNGANFIIEELKSIALQTVIPDEVLILDDVSTDDTFVLCQKFIEENRLSNWKVIQNEKNIGFIANFFKGFNLATGDVIFIADQDDIWEPDKVRIMLNYFEQNEKILCLASTFAQLRDGIILKEHVNHPHRIKHDIKEISISEYCSFRYYLGMSIAFKRNLLSLVKEEYIKKLTYDILLTSVACACKGLYYLDKALTKRRSHANSTGTKSIQKNLMEGYKGNRHLYNLDRDINALQLLLQINQDVGSQDSKLIEEYFFAANRRKEIFINRSIIQWFMSYSIVFRSYGLKTYVLDTLKIIF